MTQPVDTAHSGNTNTECAKSRIRSRAYMITIYDDELVHFNKAIYECWCDDTCKDGKPHKHQLVYFKSAIAWSTIKKAYKTSHIEVAKNVYDCIQYISDKTKRKTNFQEIGKRPADTRFKSTAELMETNDVSEIPWQQVNTWRKLKSDESMVVVLDDWHKDIDVYYIHGSSGKGKSHRAKELLKSLGYKKANIVKYENGFWNGIPTTGTAECCIYDDWRDSHMKPSEFINFIDYNTHTLNIKGGAVRNDYKTIVITTVQRPDEIYRNIGGEPRLQWLRRMKIEDMGHDPSPEDELTIDL